MTPPSHLLMKTYRAAALLKIAGVLTGIVSNQALLGRTLIERWWMALLTGVVLLIILLPSRTKSVRGRHIQLIIALGFGLIAHFIDIIQTTYVPFQALITDSPFGGSLLYEEYEGNNMHQLGAIFVAVPVVLACWQYEYRGLVALVAAGLLYMLTPLALPADAFEWVYYTVQGFVVLGTTLILAFTVATLSRAQRREQAQLAEAHRQLATYTMTQEQLVVSRERNRIARELHDTLAHALSGTAIQLQAVATLLPIDQMAATQELTSARQQIKSGLEESRRAIAALRATPVEQFGLQGALQRRCDETAERTAATVTHTFTGTIPHHLEQTIYRIADEALTNIEKHTAATHISVSVFHTIADGVNLIVVDDGIGFDVDGDHAGYGLLGMRERARLAGGTLRVVSRPDKTMIIFTSPSPSPSRKEGDPISPPPGGIKRGRVQGD